MVATWTGAVSNDWNNGANWSPAVVPGPGDAILIPAAPSGGRAPEILDGETVNVYGNITNDDVITLASTGDQTNFIVNGQVTLSGTGTFTLTDSSANRIYSNASNSTLDNQETVKGAGQIFSNGNLTLVNDTTGVVDATGNNALDINNITVENLGLLESTAGTGGLELVSETVDNTDAGTVDSGKISAAGGNVLIESNVHIIGGTLSSATGGQIEVASTGSTLDGGQSAAVGIAAGSVVTIENGANLTLEGTIQNDGGIQLNAAGATDTDLLVSGAVTLKGAGDVVLSDAGTVHFNRIYSNTASSTLDNQQTIEGAGEIFSNGNLTLDNDTTGVIDATGANALAVHDITVNNAHLLESTGTGGLSIYNATISNLPNNDSGQIVADGAGTQVDINNSTVVGGKLITEAGGVIEATVGSSDTFDGTHAGEPIDITSGSAVSVINGAALNIAGTIENDGRIQLNATGESNTDLIVDGAVTLQGAGAVVMSDIGTIHYNRIYSNTTGSTLDNQETIEGAGEIFSNGNLTLNNDDVIDATGANALAVHDITVNNAHLLETTAGTGGLSIYNATINDLAGGDAGQIVADGAQVDINNSTIVGGKLITEAGGVIEATVGSSDTFDGTHVGEPINITSGSAVSVVDSAALKIAGAIENDGQLQLNATGADNTDLIVAGAVTLQGAGDVVLSDKGTVHYNRIYSNTPNSTLDNQQTIEGAGEIFSNGNLTLNNDDVVDATGVNALAVHDITVNNAHLLESTGTGGLSIYNATISNLAGNDSGQIVANGAGTHVDINNSTIVGGELISENGGVINATVGSSDTFDGTNSSAPVDITSGSIVALADGAALNIKGTIENDGQLQLNATGPDNTDLIVNGAVTLTGVGEVVLSDQGTVHYNRIYSNTTGSTLDNQELIEGAGEILSNGNLTLNNDDAVDANGDNALAVHDMTVNNADLLESTSGAGGLSIYNATINNLVGSDVGQIVADGDVTHVDINNSTIIGGDLVTEDGGVINVTPGSSDTFDGTNPGAPVDITSNSVVAVADGAVLNIKGTIQNDGELQLNATGADNTDLIVNGDTTLMGEGALILSDAGTVHYNRIYSNTSGSTLDNQEAIEGAGEIFSNGNLSLINDTTGVINANGANALDIHDISFTNDGTVAAGNGGTLEIDDALTNISADANHIGGSVLTGGVYNVVDQNTYGEGPGAASTIAISGDGANKITTLAATVDLAGQPSQLTANGVSLANSLLEVADDGDLNLYYGYNSGYSQNFADPNAVTIDEGGQVFVAGADFSSAGLTIVNGGYLLTSGEFDDGYSIYATVEGPIVNNGLIVADGVEVGATQPTSYFGGPITGSGAISLDQDALAEFGGGVGYDQTIYFGNDQVLSDTLVAGEQTIRIDSTTIDPDGSGPDDFAATIANFTLGDAIDLANFDDVSDYSYSDGTLTVYFDSDQTATLNFSGVDDDTVFRFSPDGDGGTLITTGTGAELAADTGVSATDGLTYDPALTGTGDAGATLLFRENGELLGTTTVDDNGLWTFKPAGLDDGVQTIVVSEGSTESSFQVASVTFALATQAPSVSASETLSGLTNKTTNLISGEATAEDVAGNGIASVEIEDLDDDVVRDATLGADGAFSATLTGLSDGVHVFTVFTTDNAGNVTVTPLSEVIIATQAPTVFASESVSGATTQTDDIITATAIAEDPVYNPIVSVLVYDGQTELGAATASGASWSYTASNLALGVHDFSLVTTDGAGNSTTTTLAPVTVVNGVDPTVNASISAPGLTNQASEIISETAAAVSGNTIAGVEVYDNSEDLGAASFNADTQLWSFTATGLADGANDFSTVTIDSAGNQTTTALPVVDIATQAPVNGSHSESVSGITNKTSETISVTPTVENVPGNGVASVEIIDTSTDTTTAATLGAGGVYSATLTGLGDGAHELDIVTTDEAGNSTTTPLAAVDIATQAPVNSSPSESFSGITNQTSETISVTPSVEDVTGNGVVSVEIVDTSTNTTTAATLGAGGVYSATLTGLSDGAHAFEIVTTDEAGNSTTTPLTAVDIATQAPTVNASESVSGTTTQTSDVLSATATTEDISGDSIASVLAYEGETELGAATLSDGVWSYTVGDLALGAHDFSLVTTDAAGNSTTSTLAPVDVVSGFGPTVNASISTPGLTKQTSETISETATASAGNTVVSVEVFDNSVNLGAASFNSATQTWSFTATGLADGANNFSTVTTDSADNQTSVALPVVDIATLAPVNGSPGETVSGITNKTSETISVTPTVENVPGNGVASVEIVDTSTNTTTAATLGTGGVYSATLTGLSDGAHVFDIVTTDNAGNSTTTPLTAVDIATQAPTMNASESVSGTTTQTTDVLTATVAAEEVPGDFIASVVVYDGESEIGAATLSDGEWSYTADLTLGGHTFTLVATDAAGNSTTKTLAAVDVVSGFNPTVNASISTPGLTNQTSETISETTTASAGNTIAGVEVFDNSEDLGAASFNVQTQIWSYTATGLADGANNFSTVTTDSASNQTTVALPVVDIATQAPVNGSPSESLSGLTNKTSETISVTPTVENVPSDGIASVEVFDTSTQTETAATLGAGGVYSATLAGLSDGAHVFDIITTDKAGNSTTTRLSAVDIATQAPTVNAGESVSGTTTLTSDLLSETATAEDISGDSIATVLAYDGETELGAATLSDGVWSYTAGDLGLGAHDFSLVTTDAAGNSTTSTLAPVDVVSGSGPTVNASISAPGLTNQTSETVSETATAVGDNTITGVEVFDNDTDLGAASFNSDAQTWSFTASGLADGAHDFSTETTDSGDNTTTTTLPVVDIATVGPVNGSPSESVSGLTNKTSETISVTPTVENVPGNAVASVEIVDTSTDTRTAATLGAGGVYSATLTGLGDGAHVFDIVTTDKAGNTTTTTLAAVDIATQAPVNGSPTESVSGITNKTSETISVRPTVENVPGNVVASVEIVDTSTSTTTAATLGAGGVYSATLTGLGDGAHLFDIVTTDKTGNTTTTALAAVDIATQAPVNGSPSESVSGLTNKTNETISVTPSVENIPGNGISSVDIVDTSTNVATAAALGIGGVYSAALTGLSDGAHVFDIVTTDKAGNSTTTALAAVDVATQAPTVNASESVSGTTGLTTDVIAATAAAEQVPNNSIASVVVYDGETELGQATPSDGVWSYTASDLALGAHDLSLLTTDTAGNSTTTALAPVDVVVPLTVSADESVSGLTDLISDTISETATAAPGLTIASVEAFDGYTDLGAATYDAATGVWSFNAQNLSDGTHDLATLTTDSAGDTDLATLNPLEVATTPPTVAASQSLSGLTNENQDTITETATAEAVGPNAVESVEIYDGATNLGAATLSGGLWTFATGILPDGAHHLTTVTTDAAANQTTTTLPVIHVATNLPRVKTSESVSGLTNQSSVTITETAIAEQVAGNAIQSVEVYDSATALGAATLSAGVWSFTTAPLADGVHDLSTVTTDAAGNTTTKALAPVDVATAPPTVTASQSLGRLTNQTQDTITETATADAVGANAIEAVEVYDGATDLGPATLVSGTWTFTTGILADGAHHLSTVTTDAAGNQTTTTLPVVLHVGTSPPRVKASESVSGLTNQSSVTITETAIAEQVAFNAIQSVEVYDGATALGAATLSGGVWTFTTATLADGVLDLSTVTTDAAGNTTTKALAAVDVATAPPTVTASQTLGRLTDQTQDTITVAANAEAVGPNAIESVEVYDGANALGAATLSAGVWSFTTGILSDGAHHLATVTTDAAGNQTTTTLPVVVHVATNPPRVKASESASGLTNQNRITVSETAIAEAVAFNAIQSVEVYDGATALGAATLSAGVWTFTTATLADGVHHFHTMTTDAAGNTTTKTLAAVDVATAPPTVTASQSLSGLTNQTQDTIAETATAEAVGANAIASVDVFDGSTDLGAATFFEGAWTFTTQQLAFGAHDLSTVTTDAVGNATTTLLAPINVEPPAPNVSIALVDDTSDGLDISSDDALSGGGDPGAAVQFTIDGSPVAQTATADSNGYWTFTPTGLSQGLHTIVASETNGGGTGSATLSFTYVTTPPTVAIVTPSGTVAFPSETIDGVGEAGTTVQLFDGSQTLGETVDVGADGLWSDTVTLPDAGANTLTAADTDPANNIDVSSAITLFLDNQIVGQPSQTQVSSTTGDDHIIVDAANATVNALGGDNTVSLTSAGGGTQFHIINGGGGSNTLDLSGTSGGAIVNLGTQLATGPQIGTNDVFNFQNIIGGAGPETLTLNTAPGGGTGPAGGGAGTPTLDETSGGGFIEAGSGDDIMTGSPNGSTFAFLSAFGNDTITNFNVSGSTHDVFVVSQSLFANWAAIDAALSDTLAGAELVLSAAETVTFTGVTKAALEANSTADFRFV